MDGGRVLSPGCRLEGGGCMEFGVCSVCLNGSLSCQQRGGIICSPVSARQKAPFKYTSK